MKYKCAGEHCPGYPYPASERMHPGSCITGDLDADNLGNEWRPAAIEDPDGTETWYVVDDSDDPQPVAICPRGKDVATEICFNRQMIDPIWGAADEAKHGELERRNLELLNEIEQWKDASGLEVGGDPDGVTPDMLRKYIDKITPPPDG